MESKNTEKSNSEAKKRIAIVTGSLGLGGLQKIVVASAAHFVSMGYQVRIFTLLQNREQIFQNLPSGVDHIDFETNSDVYKNKLLHVKGWIKFLKKSFGQFEPDFIFAMTFKIGSLCCLSGKKYAKKVVVREINDPLGPGRSKFTNSIFEFFCRHAKGFIFQTEYEKSCFWKTTQRRAIVIPNPCRVDVMPSQSFDGRIVSTGRFDNRQKRYDVMLRGFDIFADKNGSSTLHIYGSGTDETEIRDIAVRCKHSDRIVFEGPTKNVLEKINGASCFVLTSDFEGMSNSLLEAYLSGVPCVTSDWPGYDAIIQDGSNGFVFHRGDEKDFAAKLFDLLNDEIKAVRFSKKGIEDRIKFDPLTVLDRYLKFIVG